MPNTQQNNEVEHINKEIHSLQDRLKRKKKSMNQFQNGLRHIRKIWVEKRKRSDLSQTKKIQNIVKDIVQNKIKQIKNNTNLLQNILTQVKKERDYLKKDWRK